LCSPNKTQRKQISKSHDKSTLIFKFPLHWFFTLLPYESDYIEEKQLTAGPGEPGGPACPFSPLLPLIPSLPENPLGPGSPFSPYNIKCYK